MDWTVIANLILGGGLIATILAIMTLRSSIAKAKSEAEEAKARAKRAEAEAESVSITNTEQATRILVQNIVNPLKQELNATREDLQATKDEMVATKREIASTKREMGRLRKAVEAATRCPHSDGCPVLQRMQSGQGEPTEPDGGLCLDVKRGANRIRADTAREPAATQNKPQPVA